MNHHISNEPPHEMLKIVIGVLLISASEYINLIFVKIICQSIDFIFALVL